MLTGHTDLVRAISFSSDCRQIASASSDQIIKLWDVAKVSKVSRLLGSTLGSRLKFRVWQEIKTLQQVNSVKFSTDGQHLVTNLDLINIKSPIDIQSSESKLKDLGVRDHWICYGEVPLLLLRSNFEQQRRDIKVNQVTIGIRNGRVLNFDIDRLSLNSIFNNSA
jgi:WD40 repeat protein